MRLHLMDYSLLLGIHDIARAEMEGSTQNESEDDVIEVGVKMSLQIGESSLVEMVELLNLMEGN